MTKGIIKRALVMFPSTIAGGCEHFAIQTAKTLSANGVDTHAGFPESTETAWVVKELNSAGVRYHSLDIRESGHPQHQSFLSQKRRFVRTTHLLESLRPDACLMTTPSIQYMCASMYACHLMHIPACVSFQYVQNTYNFSDKHLEFYHAAKGSQAWVAVSENNRDLLAMSFRLSRNEFDLVPNGADIKRFYPKPAAARLAAKEQLCAELGIPVSSRLFTTVGALRSQKGYDLLIKAIANLSIKAKDIHWIWVGEGAARKEYTEAATCARLNERIHMIGQRSDVPEILAATDCFVFPSRFEGQPFALLEAMASGLPILTSDASGITEIVTHLKDGIVFSKDSSEAITNAILYAIENEDALRQMARQAVITAGHFSQTRMTENIMSILDRIAKSAVTQLERN